MNLEDYQRLKRKAEQFKAEADRAEGASGQLLAEMKREFGCDSAEKAKKIDASLRKEESKAEAEWERAAKEMEKWAGRMEG